MPTITGISQQDFYERVNTYLDFEFFKIVVIGETKTRADEVAKWLAGVNEDAANGEGGVFRRPHKRTEAVIYSEAPKQRDNQHATVSVDALIIVVDTEEGFGKVKEEVETHYPNIAVRVVYSEHPNSKTFASQLKAGLTHESNRDTLFDQLDKLDQAEFNNIKNALANYDLDKNGIIDLKEIENIAKSLGANTNTESFKSAMLALDINHDNRIDLNEFVQWWKIGRHNIPALTKVYELNIKANKFIEKVLNINKIKEIFASNIGSNTFGSKTNNVSFFLDSNEVDEYRSRLVFKLAAGGQKRIDAVRNFLSKFTKNHNSVNDNWISFSVFLKSCTIKGQSCQIYLERFRDNIIQWAQDHFMPELANFIKHFLVFKFYPMDYSATMIFEIKLDVLGLIKYALDDFITIKNYLTNNGNDSLDIDIDVLSKDGFEYLLNNNKELKDLLEGSETKITSSGVKDFLRAVLTNLGDDCKDLEDTLQFLHVPSKMNLKVNGPFSEFVNDSNEVFFSHKLKPLEDLVDFVRTNFDKEFLQYINRFELAFNLFDVFCNLQVYSETLWDVQQ